MNSTLLLGFSLILVSAVAGGVFGVALRRRRVFPSVRGDIEVEWRRDSGRCRLQVTLPPELKTTLAAPAAARGVLLDGRPVSELEHTVVGGEHQMEWTP